MKLTALADKFRAVLFYPRRDIVYRRRMGIGGKSAGDYVAQQIRAIGGGVLISPTPLNMHKAEIEEFSQALLDGREPAISAELRVRSQGVLAACYKSAATCKNIKLAA